MARILTLLLLLSVNLLAAYTDNTVASQIGENGSASLVSFKNNSQHENTVSHQADALNGLSNHLVLASILKGAKIGAIVGCSLAIVSASNAKNFIVGAVTGGATGALIEHSSGKTQIAQRVELVNPNQLVRNICKTNDTMETLTTSLPDLLAAQIEELEVLSFNRDMGTLSQGAYEKWYS